VLVFHFQLKFSKHTEKKTSITHHSNISTYNKVIHV